MAKNFIKCEKQFKNVINNLESFKIIVVQIKIVASALTLQEIFKL